MGDIKRLTLKNHIQLIDEIRTCLSDARMGLLQETVFGPWLMNQEKTADPILCLTVLEHQINNGIPNEMWFRINGHNVRFGRRDFCLITGFRFGEEPDIQDRTHVFVRRAFGRDDISVKDVRRLFDRIQQVNDGFTDDEAVRICLLAMIERFFLGHQNNQKVPSTILALIDDLELWNSFPWGSYIWDYTYSQINFAVLKRQTSVVSSHTTLTGFLFALKIWVVETFPVSRRLFTRYDRMPRGVRWYKESTFSRKHVEQLLALSPEQMPMLILPDEDERQQQWYIDSEQWFGDDGDDDDDDDDDDQGDGDDDDDDQGDGDYEIPSHMEREYSQRTYVGGESSDRWERNPPHGGFGPSHMDRQYSQHKDWSPWNTWKSQQQEINELKNKMGQYDSYWEQFKRLSISAIESGEQPVAAVASYYSTIWGGIDQQHPPEKPFQQYPQQQPTSMMGSIEPYIPDPPVGDYQSSYSIPPPVSSGPIENLFSWVQTGYEDTNWANSSDVTVQTPVQDVQPALGRGMREKRPTAAVVTPYQNPSNNTEPKRNLEQERKSRKSQKADYVKRRPRPSKESSVVNKYWADELEEATQIRYLTESVDSLWWSQLLALDGQGWFEESHMTLWVETLMAWRQENARWTCMLPEMWSLMSVETNLDPVSHGIPMISGERQGYPAWDTVALVYIPICIANQHWVLGILNMSTMSITIHDTLGAPTLQQKLFEAWTLFTKNLITCFDRLNDEGRVGMLQQYSQYTIAPDTPRESGSTSDCGPWVCRMLAEYTRFLDFSGAIDSPQTIVDFRHRMADLYWTYRLV